MSDKYTPGDIYEDVFYQPCLCVHASVEDDEIWGISLTDGTYPRACSLAHNDIRKITVEEAWQIKQERFG